MILSAGPMEAHVAPEAGGALLALTVSGRPVLRTAAAGASDPLELACFPLVPYANRIACGRFQLDGMRYRLRRNFGDHPHCLHGVGWHRAWTVVAHLADRLALELRHDGDDDWPFPFAARQVVGLDAGGLTLQLAVTNLDDAARPVGLGFHPYFVIGAESRLTFMSREVLLSSDDMLPVGAVDADHFGNWRDGALIAGDTLIDNAYAGWSGIALIEHGDGIRVQVDAGDASWLHLYRPPRQEFVCLEPVTHMPDAINRATGMPCLAAGDSLTIAMRIGVDRRR